ncbi:unnamed protein product, partial [Symbiodinium sp. KB8]
LSELPETPEKQRDLRSPGAKSDTCLEAEVFSRCQLGPSYTVFMELFAVADYIYLVCHRHFTKSGVQQASSLHAETRSYSDLCQIAYMSRAAFWPDRSSLTSEVASFFEDSNLASLWAELEKHWDPKVRSRRNLVEGSGDGGDDGDDAECLNDEEQEEEEECEEEATLTEPEDDDDRLEQVDPYLAEAMGLEAGSPPPPSAYVGTIAYEASDDLGPPIPYESCEAFGAPACEVDLVRELAEIEQRMAHRRAALSGRLAAQKWSRILA